MPKYKQCPRCKHFTLAPAGNIRAGPRNGLRTVRYCKRCGFRSIDKYRKVATKEDTE